MLLCSEVHFLGLNVSVTQELFKLIRLHTVDEACFYRQKLYMHVIFYPTIFIVHLV